MEPVTSYYHHDQRPKHAYDFYSAESENAPLAILIHGGAWTFGSKNFFRSDDPKEGGAGNGMYRVREAFSQVGFAVAAINYRLTDEVVFPLPLHDVKTAIRFFKENAADFKINPDKIVVFGESAGGHLAQLIAATGDLKEYYYEGIPKDQLDSATSTSIAAAVSFYTPSEPHMLVQDRAAFARGEAYDTSMEPDNKLMGGPYPGEEGTVVATAWRMSAPYTLARRATPDGERRWAPTFLAHGTADVVVPLAQSERVAAVLGSRDIQHELHLIEGADHAVPAIYQDDALLAQMLNFVNDALV